jgi:hypothetical protein
MIIEKLDDLCTKNGTNLTALCKEITGSSGNLPTWRKDKIRPDWLRQICLKFNISSDFLLDLSSAVDRGNSELSQAEREVLIRFNRLQPDYQIKAQAYMVDLFERQEDRKTFSDRIQEWADDTEDDNEDSVAAEDSFQKAK